MHYLRKIDSKNFGFVIEGTHEILNSDIAVTSEDYERWKGENETKWFRLKAKPTGASLFDYIEEYIPEKKPIEQGAEEFMLDLEYRVSLIELGV